MITMVILIITLVIKNLIFIIIKTTMVIIRELFDYYQAGGLETAEELEVENQTSKSNHQNNHPNNHQNQTIKNNHNNHQIIKITIKTSLMVITTIIIKTT